jgi:phage repressor protein C with HTH and peptisase S24 domain
MGERMKDSVGARLKALREEAGLSLAEMAKAIGKAKTSYQYYEDDYDKATLPLDFVKLIIPILTRNGVERRRVLALTGLDLVTFDVDGDTAGLNRRSRGDVMAVVEELDVRAAAGGGATHEDEAVVAEWSLPKALLKFATNALPDHIKILTVVGDSMPLTFRSFDKVLVDTSDKKPSPPGIFAVWDGLGLVVKRVEFIPFSDPPTVRITSENSSYSPYERSLEEAHIQGRVLGKWQWV